ncbi:MAG: DNA-binding response regulator, partial [Alcaligenaceae bacterium]|nr:DNA-binding response regulator [Alcaligenaceae bacterium]
GLTSKECAAALKISVRTVEIHRANIIHKYQVRNIVELVYRIKQCGMMEQRRH